MGKQQPWAVLQKWVREGEDAPDVHEGTRQLDHQGYDMAFSPSVPLVLGELAQEEPFLPASCKIGFNSYWLHPSSSAGASRYKALRASSLHAWPHSGAVRLDELG